MATAQLDKLLLDASTTVQQKIDCLKLLKVVVKNLSDPAKSADPKYRQLKLDNEKVRSKLLGCPTSLTLLQSLGFVEEDDNGTKVLRVSEGSVNNAAMNTMLQEIVKTLSQLDQSEAQNKKPKLNHANSTASTASTASISSSSTSTTAQLSEKQKARLLREEKEKKEKEAAKAQRKKNVALLKQDAYVRKNDENWTSGVSAACAKTGDSISTFRDKYGEH